MDVKVNLKIHHTYIKLHAKYKKPVIYTCSCSELCYEKNIVYDYCICKILSSHQTESRCKIDLKINPTSHIIHIMQCTKLLSYGATVGASAANSNLIK